MAEQRARCEYRRPPSSIHHVGTGHRIAAYCTQQHTLCEYRTWAIAQQHTLCEYLTWAIAQQHTLCEYRTWAIAQQHTLCEYLTRSRRSSISFN
eukprot:3941911-Rhodomonas_salina.3